MKIIPLTEQYYKQASKLVNSVFNDEDCTPSKELKASICEKEFKKYQKHYDDEISSLEYYVAINDDISIVGIVGLYTMLEDEKDTIWLGWYCVNPKNRGQKIGKALLDFAIKEANNKGKKYLSLYTSTDDNEKAAQKIYELNGFYITDVEKKEDYSLLYRRKTLY